MVCLKSNKTDHSTSEDGVYILGLKE